MIWIKDMGYQFVNVGGFEANVPEGSGDYLFLYLRCDAEFCLDGEHYITLPKDTYLIYDKDFPRRYRKWDGHYINDWIHFDIDPDNGYFDRLGVPLNTPVSLPNSREISEATSDLLIEYFSQSSMRKYRLSEKADQLFVHLAKLYHFSLENSERMNQHRSEFIELRKQIQCRQYCPHSIDEAARRFHMSTSHFQHLYKTFFGTSLNQDIISARIEQACHLLERTDYSVQEISRLCEYENTEHFSRIFKKYKNCSPKNWREERG